MPIRKFVGPGPPGPTFQMTSQMKPVEFFFQFFSLHLFQMIAEWTSAKLVAEIRAWFGIHIIMGIVRVNNSRDYWSDHPALRNEMICKTMKRNRFDQIAQHLTCCSPEDDLSLMPDGTSEETSHKYNKQRMHPNWPIQVIWDTVLENCRTKYHCLRELAIDEAMIRYKGFKSSAQKFFMPSKPIKAGFKIYAMAESVTGYMCGFRAHIKTNPATKIVDMTIRLAKSHLNLFHHIFCDKFYTSVKLAELLADARTYVTGAIKMVELDFRLHLPRSQEWFLRCTELAEAPSTVAKRNRT
jgi:hypothetical protein